MAKGETRGQRVIRFIETYLIVPEGVLIGQPFKLAEFQKKWILAVYDNPVGTSRGDLSIARKNGKTGLIAALVLVHLVGPEAVRNSHILSGARSKDQAGMVYRYASKTAEMSPRIRDIVKSVPSTKRLIGIPLNVEFRAMAAEGKTAHGESPILAILDEVGQVKGPQDDFIDAIITSQGAYNDPLLLTISTQAATDGDLYSIWLDDAKLSKDPRIVSHVYAADEDAEVMDEKAWQAANPALDLFRSRTDVVDSANKASRMPSFENTFRNLYLNQRVSTLSTFVSRDVWADNGTDPGVMIGPVYAGLDLSKRTDLTAFVVVHFAEDQTMVWPFFWAPEEGILDRSKRDRVPYDVWAAEGWLRTTPGATVDYAFVAHEIAEIIDDLEVIGIAFDRWRIDELKKEFDALNVELPLIEFGQGYKDMSPALDALESDLLNARIAHGGHPVLTMCAANAIITRDPAGNRKLDKHKATGRIDGMVALAMAEGLASKMLELSPQNIYDTRGVVSI